MERVWWCIELRKGSAPAVFMGRVYETEKMVREALGPWIEIRGNLVTIFGQPPKVA
jgi:hypothetical protein